MPCKDEILLHVFSRDLTIVNTASLNIVETVKIVYLNSRLNLVVFEFLVNVPHYHTVQKLKFFYETTVHPDYFGTKMEMMVLYSGTNFS